jgi:hypothetical protein
VIEGLGLTEPGLRRIIAANAPGYLSLEDWHDNLDAYALYVADTQVVRVKRAKKSGPRVRYKLAPAAKPRPSLLRNVEREIHSLLCTNSKRYAPIRRPVERHKFEKYAHGNG